MTKKELPKRGNAVYKKCDVEECKKILKLVQRDIDYKSFEEIEQKVKDLLRNPRRIYLFNGEDGEHMDFGLSKLMKGSKCKCSMAISSDEIRVFCRFCKDEIVLDAEFFNRKHECNGKHFIGIYGQHCVFFCPKNEGEILLIGYNFWK